MIAPHIGGKIRLFSRYARGLPFSCILDNLAGSGRLFSELRVISSMDLNGELFGLTRRFFIGTASASLQLSETGCSQGIQASSAVSQKKSDWRRALTLRRGGQQGASCIAKQEQKGVDLL